MDNKITYTPVEVSEILNTTTATVRRYADFFEIEALREKTTKGKGHRKYTEENLQLMKKIHDLIQVQNLSWKLAKEVADGDKFFLPAGSVPKEEELNYKSLEERLNQQEKVISEMFKKMTEIQGTLDTEKHLRIQSEKKEETLRIESEKKEETLLLELEEMKQKIEEKVPEQKNKSWLSRFFLG